MTDALAHDPLLQPVRHPPFDRISVDTIVPAIRKLLADLGAEVTAIEASAGPTWDATLAPLERIGERLGYAWGLVNHLGGVRSSAELRRAHETVQGDVVAFQMRLGQSRAIFDAMKALRDSGGLDGARLRVLDRRIQAAELSGVGLDGADREDFNAIAKELDELDTKFENNVLDATKVWSMTLTGEADVEGLPETALRLYAKAAADAGEEGWRVTLDHPSYVPFIKNSPRRELRERLYRGFVTRATGDLDNGPFIDRILELRKRMAKLLGFETYADLSLTTKMAPDVAAVRRLSEELRDACWSPALEDLEAMKALAREQGAPEADDFKPWDAAFWSERLREKRFAYRDEELRPWLPLPRVLEGVFSLVERLFRVRIEEATGAVPTWHEDVSFYRVLGESGAEIAAVYMDLYSRPAEKRGGAWFSGPVGRSREAAEAGKPVRLPVGYLICNQMPPVGGRPSLMSFGEVTTLFHELGHGLQHMLTTVDEGLCSGIRNIEWDAVEIASQFMENWCYHPETLRSLSGHVDTGEPIPDELIEKILAAKTFQSGSQMIRQLRLGLVDLELHDTYDPENGAESVIDVANRIAERTSPIPPIPEDRFLNGFLHIFAGPYAAGYYSYKWAEVMSADAFAAFEEAGLDDQAAVAAVGLRYRDTILAQGGSRDPMEVFRDFRGREPTVDALLRHEGLTTNGGWPA